MKNQIRKVKRESLGVEEEEEGVEGGVDLVKIQR